VNPLRLRVSSYRCFDELTLDLPTGCVAVLGENGAGKSSIVSAIDLAIFGPESRSLADALSDTAGPDDDLLIELAFEHAGDTYRVRRTYSARGRGKSLLDFERWKDTPEHSGDDTGPEWTPLTCESAKATQELIEKTIGLSRETFRASAMLMQGDGAAFTEAQPRDRKRILAEVLGLDRYDALLERAKQEGRRVAGDLERLAGRTQAASELVQTKADVERQHGEAVVEELDAADAVADREREHRELAEQYQAAREQGSQRRAAEADLATVREKLDTLMRAETAAAEAEKNITVARAELAELATDGQLDELLGRERMLVALEQSYRDALASHQADVAAHRAASDRVGDLAKRITALQQRAEELRFEASMLDARPLDDGATCDRCGQQLDLEARERALKSYHADAGEHDRQAAELAAQVVEIPPLPVAPAPPMLEDDTAANHLAVTRHAIERSRAGLAQRVRLEERIAGLQRDVSARPMPEAVAAATELVRRHQEAVDSLEAVDADAIKAQGLLAKRALDDAKNQFEQARLRRARIEERLAQIALAEEQLAQAQIEGDRLADEINLCAALERALGPNGIPALIVENAAIPYLETEASRILADLGTSFRVELRTQAALKSGDGVRDTLDVIIQTQESERPYETFSGGERTRLNLALRIALARLLAHRRGADSRVLVVDEPEYLDEPGTAALVDVLRGLQDDFERIYLVSHVPALRDSFDEVLTVVKDPDGRSRVAEAGVLEAVEA
jgi:DNA repair protein SbcC/Rad50